MSVESQSRKRERLWLIAFFGFVLLLASTTVYFLWAFAYSEQQIVKRWFGTIPPPAFTSWFFEYRIGFLLLPLPWFVFAFIYAMRGSATSRQLIGFTATLMFALATCSVLAAMAFSLPWFPPAFSNRFMHLEPEQLAQALYATERNDAEANYRLFLHYAFTTRQVDLAEQYLAKASTLGSSTAQNALKLRQANAARTP